jgi:hypothetical protein
MGKFLEKRVNGWTFHLRKEEQVKIEMFPVEF